MEEILEKHIPKTAVPLVIDLLNKYPHRLKVVNKRETKHGDFRQLKNWYLFRLIFTVI